MKKILFSFLVLHVIISIDVFSQQSGWVWQNPLPQGNDLFNIKMFNSGTGYCRSYFGILKSTDFGSSWSIIKYDKRINYVFFLNETTGYYSQTDISSGISEIFKSVNGGLNWQRIYNAFSDAYFTPMNWLNETTGFAFRDYNRHRILKTTSGGVSWETTFFDTTVEISAFAFPSQTTGYLGGKVAAFGSGSKFYKSTNSGVSWDSISIPVLREVKALCFLNSLTGFITGMRRYITGPQLLRTTNGGLTWDSIYYNSSFSKIEFLDLSTGYANSFYKTTNGGFNWVQLNIYPVTNIVYGDFSLTNAENIFICGELGSLGKSTNGGTNWYSQTTNAGEALFGIRFFDENTGIAVGGNSASYVLRTTNSGLNWNYISIDSGSISAVYQLNNTTAFLAGFKKVYKTTDRGATFTQGSTPTFTYWFDVSFPSINTGYTIAKYGSVDKTTDGGNTWMNVRNAFLSESYTICFANDNTGFIGGTRLLKSTNGGFFWDTLYTGIQPSFYSQKLYYQNNILYALGNRHYVERSTAVILKSSNLGVSWAADSIVNDYDLFDISIPTPDVVYLIGVSKVHKSINGGPWQSYYTYSSTSWKSGIALVNNTTGFISTYGGGILKTTNGGGEPIGINPLFNEIPTAFNLFQNYPNPFNPTTVIQYGLPKGSLVMVRVYDILGRLVKELVNTHQPAGNYSVSFDGSNYASGVYFYTIETPDFTQSKKMVLVK